ncbi:MAG: chromate efflux transporter, partial [Deltaproteobacteria bacterium]|nr:chromate efflux transporter [Deltaproteobacteria bacterium]
MEATTNSVVERNPAPQTPSFAEAFRFWVKLGFISFGGPTGQIAIMNTELVERKRWISQERFLHALNYCMLLPGPEAQQLATYVGWLLHRTWGGIVAGAFFVIPSIFILLFLSWIYAAYGNVPMVSAAFYGLKPAVTAIVASATIQIGRRALKNEVMYLIAFLAFVGIYFAGIPFPVIIVTAGLIGFIGGKAWSAKFYVIKPHGGTENQAVIADDSALEHAETSWGRALLVIAVCGALWIAPILTLALWRGTDDIFFQIGVFFSKAAVVTFGGAYAVLAYIAQAAVEDFGWLRPGQMLDGLGLAETTPGPLIMVTQFVGFMAAWQNVTDLSPLTAAILGALITTWVTFTPCFLWIFLGAPFIERLRGNVVLTSALSAITAAVVGVVLNLAVFFAVHVLFPKNNGTILS